MNKNDYLIRVLTTCGKNVPLLYEEPLAFLLAGFIHSHIPKVLRVPRINGEILLSQHLSDYSHTMIC